MNIRKQVNYSPKGISAETQNHTPLVLGYIYKQENPEFWSHVLAFNPEFQQTIIFNFSGKIIETDLPGLVIADFVEEYQSSLIYDFLQSRKIKGDYFLLLEDNEKAEFCEQPGNFLNSLKNHGIFNIRIKPAGYEVLEYEAEPFTAYEVRLFSLKAKEFKEVFQQGDFYYPNNFETIDEINLSIRKQDTDNSFEVRKAASTFNGGLDQRAYFFLGIAYFYKNAVIAEKNFTRVIEWEDEIPETEGNKQDDTDSQISEARPAVSWNIYKNAALPMLMKLLLRKEEAEKVCGLSLKYNEVAAGNPLVLFYGGLAFLKTGRNRIALHYFHRALKNRQEIPFIYNFSDLNWKIYKYIGELFYSLNRLKNAEKFFLLADECLSERKSPELYLFLGKSAFKQREYERSYQYFSKLFSCEYIPLKLFKEAKVPFLNLLLYLDFKEEALEILSLEGFDRPAEILRVADTFYMDGDFENALRLYLLSVEKFGVENKLLFKLGYICSRLRLLPQASNYFEKYLEREPEDLDAMSNLAFIYMNMDELEKSEKVYLEVLKLNNYSFEANLHLAMIYMSRRNKAKAKYFLEKAKMLNPVSQQIIKLFQIFKAEFNV